MSNQDSTNIIEGSCTVDNANDEVTNSIVDVTDKEVTNSTVDILDKEVNTTIEDVGRLRMDLSKCENEPDKSTSTECSQKNKEKIEKLKRKLRKEKIKELRKKLFDRFQYLQCICESLNYPNYYKVIERLMDLLLHEMREYFGQKLRDCLFEKVHSNDYYREDVLKALSTLIATYNKCEIFKEQQKTEVQTTLQLSTSFAKLFISPKIYVLTPRQILEELWIVSDSARDLASELESLQTRALVQAHLLLSWLVIYMTGNAQTYLNGFGTSMKYMLRQKKIDFPEWTTMNFDLDNFRRNLFHKCIESLKTLKTIMPAETIKEMNYSRFDCYIAYENTVSIYFEEGSPIVEIWGELHQKGCKLSKSFYRDAAKPKYNLNHF